MGTPGVQLSTAVGDARLEVVSGPLKGELFPLTREGLSIGRDPSNEISLLDPLVSRRHCLICRADRGFRLQDLDSRNNTFINGVPVKERELVHGDQIRIGDSILVFQQAARYSGKRMRSTCRICRAEPCPTLLAPFATSTYC